LLVISDDEKALKETYKNIGISDFTYRKINKTITLKLLIVRQFKKNT